MIYFKIECEMENGKRTCQCSHSEMGEYCQLKCPHKCIYGKCILSNVNIL